MKFDFDVDIDLPDRDKALRGLHYVTAMVERKTGESPHPSGVYFQDIPVNPLTNLAAFDFKKASELGYFKIDLLNNSVYDGVKSEEHLNELLEREVPWELLQDENFVNEMAQLKDHFYAVKKLKPQSIEDLAMVLAIIRPGKKLLLNRPKEEIRANIWKKDDTDEYVFKKSHAIAYAFSLVVQINLLVEKMSEEILKKGSNGD